MVTAAPPPAASRPAPSPHPYHVRVATELHTDVEAASQARHVVRDLLRQGARPELAETACLLTSELVANAVTHAGAPVELVADLDRSRLTVEVIDGSPTDPSLDHPARLATSGRGLDLVDRLADSWGVTHVRAGKSVWFALGASPVRSTSGHAPVP